MATRGDSDNRRDFPGDKRNAFTNAGRTADERDVWNHLALLGKLRMELAPLRRGKSFDLLDQVQQMAYVRVTETEAIPVVFNNDMKAANVSFEVSMIKPFALNATLTDKLEKVADVKIACGKVNFSMPVRTAGIFTVKK